MPDDGLTVRIEPVGVDVPIDAGESVMAAAVRAGYRWPTVCGGEGSCRTCFLEVVDGGDHLSPIAALEREGLESLGPIAKGKPVRLACQVKVSGPAVVRKRGVRQVVLQPS